MRKSLNFTKRILMMCEFLKTKTSKNVKKRQKTSKNVKKLK